jgi:hypothetical protein
MNRCEYVGQRIKGKTGVLIESNIHGGMAIYIQTGFGGSMLTEYKTPPYGHCIYSWMPISGRIVDMFPAIVVLFMIAHLID